MQREHPHGGLIFRERKNMWEKAFPTVRSATDPFTGVKKLPCSAAEIPHWMMPVIWQVWQVYVIHRRKEFRGAAATVEKLREKENVTFVLEHQVKEITGEAKVTGVVLEDGTAIAVDGVFVAYGSVPQTALLKDLVKLDPAGYVKADETGETSLAGLYVAGDARTKKLRQVVTAVSDGANAATAVAEYLK